MKAEDITATRDLARVAAVPCKIGIVLTDNGIQFAERAREVDVRRGPDEQARSYELPPVSWTPR